MPVRVMQAADRVGFLQCEVQTGNATGRHPQETPWTTDTILGFQAAGYKGWVWRNAGGTVLGGIIGRRVVLPTGVGGNSETWLEIVKAVVRVSSLPAGNDREKAILRAAKFAVDNEGLPFGSVGVRMYVDNFNTRLINFLDATFQAAVTKTVVGEHTLYVFRHLPGTPELNTATPVGD